MVHGFINPWAKTLPRPFILTPHRTSGLVLDQHLSDYLESRVGSLWCHMSEGLPPPSGPENGTTQEWDG